MGRSGAESSAGQALVGWTVIADPEQVRRVALSAASSPMRPRRRAGRTGVAGGGEREHLVAGGELRGFGATYARRACSGRGKGRTWRRGRASRNKNTAKHSKQCPLYCQHFNWPWCFDRYLQKLNSQFAKVSSPTADAVCFMQGRPDSYRLHLKKT